MSLGRRCFVTMVVLSVATFSACKYGGIKLKETATGISLTAPNTTCLQNGVGGTNLTMGPDGVSWSTTPSSATIEVHFAAGCGFPSCDFPAQTGPVPSGPSSLPDGVSITYTHIKLNGQECQVNNGVGSAGLIMHR
jgi:hypothetical protein